MSTPRKFVLSINVCQVEKIKESFKVTSQRLQCAIQRDILSGGEAETGGFLKFCINAEKGLKNRELPLPTFCNRMFVDQVIEMD